MSVIAITFLVLYLLLSLQVIYKVSKGKVIYLFLYIIFFLPFYSVFQSIIYSYFQNEILINSIRFSKDIVLYSSFFIFLFGQKESILTRLFYLTFLDKLVIFFTIYFTVFFLLPIGDSPFYLKSIYFKNLFLIPAMYFVGRNINISETNWNSIVRFFKNIVFLIFFIVLMEFIFATHLHTLIDFSQYNLEINNFHPQGNYDLTWTFEKGDAKPRYAAFFSNPLALSASLLCYLAVFFSEFFYSNKKIVLHILLVFIVFYLGFSRASILGAVLIMICFILLSGKLRLFLVGSFIFIFITLIIIFFANDDFLYFLEDTFYFVDTSSLGHLFEWIQSIISIYENPFGVGLATSGNANSVAEQIKIGGENQFLIFGVQMGIIFMLLYILIILKTIINSFKVFKKSKLIYCKKIGFSLFLLKIGLIIPSLTSNIEIYLFVSLFSWTLAGINENIHNKIF